MLTHVPKNLVIIQVRKGNVWGSNYIKSRLNDPGKFPIRVSKLPPGFDPGAW